MAQVVRRVTVDAAGLAAVLTPRTMLVLERDARDGRFELVDGPMGAYARTVDADDLGDGTHLVTETPDFEVAVPYLAWLAAGQTVARAFATALLVVAGIVAAEEMPRRARAYAISLLGMTSALGVGICVLALRLADIDDQGWRLLYLIPLLALLVVPGI